MATVWKVEDEANRVVRSRRAFRDTLVSLATPDSDVDAAELIFGELVANTLRHARGPVEVRLDVDGHAQLVVRDRGPGFVPAPREAGDHDEHGRGLFIVRCLASDVRVVRIPGGGTEIRATLPVFTKS